MRTPWAPRCSTWEKNVVSWFDHNDYIAYHYAFMMKVATIWESGNFSKTAKDPRWVEVMNEDMQALSKNKTWDLVPSLHHQKAIGCEWIIKVNHNADGTVNRYKAWLVAKGCGQTHGVDYEESFAQVPKKTTIKTVLVLAPAKGWHLHHMNVKNAFPWRWIRWGGVHGTTTKLRIEHTPASSMLTQKASLRPQAGIYNLALEDNPISSPHQLKNIQVWQFPIHLEWLQRTTVYYKTRSHSQVEGSRVYY